MTTEELAAKFRHLSRLIQSEIAVRKRSDVYRTKLAEWQLALEELIAIKDELKRHIGEQQELVDSMEQITFLPPPPIKYQ